VPGERGFTGGFFLGGTAVLDAPWRWSRIAGVNTATLHMQSVIGPKKGKYRKNTKNIVQPARILLPFPHIQANFSETF